MSNEINNEIRPNMENGKLNAFGLDISIADIVGGKIVDKWFSQLTDDDMALIFKAVEEELFDHNYKDEKFFKKNYKVNNSSWGNNYEDTPTWKITKQKFAEKYNDIILSKVDEILDSKEYQDRATQIAKEIVDYATEGYKIDMFNRVRERLVTNTVDTYPTYNSADLRSIIREEIGHLFPNRCY